MKTPIIFLFATLISFTVLGQELETAFAQKECLQRFSPVVFEYVRLSEIWLNNPNSTLNLNVNFNELTKTHKTFLEGLKNFKTVVPTETGSSTQILKYMRDLEDYQQKKIGELETQLEKDSKFLTGVYDLDFSMTNIYNALSTQPFTGCPTEYKERLEKLKSQSLQWKNTFTNYKDYVVKAREKRVELFQLIHDVIQAKLKNDYKKSIGANADKALKQIENILEAEKIQKEMLTWFYQSTKGKFLYGLSDKEALKELRVLTYDLGNFQKRIMAIEFLPLTQKSLLSDHAKYQSFVTNEIHKREKK